jgi:hypothetical protein
MLIAQVAIAVLGVLFISSEYWSGMIHTSLIAVPKRGRVLPHPEWKRLTVTVTMR